MIWGKTPYFWKHPVLCPTASPDISGVQMFLSYPQHWPLGISMISLLPPEKFFTIQTWQGCPSATSCDCKKQTLRKLRKKTKLRSFFSLKEKWHGKGNPQIFMQKNLGIKLYWMHLKTQDTPKKNRPTNHSPPRLQPLAFQTWRQSHVTQRHRSTRSLLPGRTGGKPSQPYHTIPIRIP